MWPFGEGKKMLKNHTNAIQFTFTTYNSFQRLNFFVSVTPLLVQIKTSHVLAHHNATLSSSF